MAPLNSDEQDKRGGPLGIDALIGCIGPASNMVVRWFLESSTGGAMCLWATVGRHLRRLI